MKLPFQKLATWVCCGLALTSGCTPTETLHYFGDADLNYYKQEATSVSYPNVESDTQDLVVTSLKPPTVRDPSQAPTWELSLAEAIETAIANSKVIRSRNSFKQPMNQMMSNPDRVTSTYDPGIQETSTNFFSRGPESALSAFDTQFKTSANYSHDNMLQNNILLGGGVGLGGALIADQSQFQSSLQKVMANGGTLELSNNWNFLATNQPFQLFSQYYAAQTRIDYRQPLWAGAGVDYTRIAGPIARTIPGITIVDQGVLIARINTDITVADFELNVVTLVRDVIDLYWELYLAYRTYDAELKARDMTHAFWQSTKRKVDAGFQAGGKQFDEAQARENYFNARARVENAITSLYTTEQQLRRMLYLPVNDGRIIRPKDNPVSVEFVSDWTGALLDSLTYRAELRRQKWQIKSLELQLRAAESQVKPRLDFIGGYQLNGFGNRLFGDNDNSPGAAAQDRFQGAYETLLQTNQTSWDFGVEFSLPLGFRQAMAQKRNIELKLMKARAVLSAQELEISHELANALAMIDNYYQVTQTSIDRVIAAVRQQELAEKEFEVGRATADLVLRLQANRASAETQYYTALTRYNQAIADFHQRKGTLLTENSIHLAESEWEEPAYQDALRRAWARSYARENPHLQETTEPLSNDSSGGYLPYDATLAPQQVPQALPGAELPPVPAMEPVPQ
ncbi:MAG: TolC family protein [Planctomycetaceae bacterium]